MMRPLMRWKQRWQKLYQQTKSYLDEIKKLIAEPNASNKVHVISYFTYSLSISHDSEQASLRLSPYHVHNIGIHPITNPYICIKVPPESPFSLMLRMCMKPSSSR